MSTPIYIQIVKDIKEKINNGIIKPGDMIKSENDLSKEYNASRMTIRKSLSLLANEGYVYSVPGKGNFVCEPDQNRYILHFNEMDSFESSIDKTELLEVSIIPPTLEIMLQLKIHENKKIVMIRRLLYSEEEPVAYDVKYLPYDRGRPIVEEEIHYATFPEMVAKKASPFTIKKELKIRVVKSLGEICTFLRLDEGHPLLVIEQKILTSENKPIGWGQIFVKGEYCQLNAVSSLIDKSENIF